VEHHLDEGALLVNDGVGEVEAAMAVEALELLVEEELLAAQRRVRELHRRLALVAEAVIG